MMARSYSKDRFDVAPDDLQRVGAHRAPLPRWHWLIWVGWSALAIVIIVGAGVAGLNAINGNVDFKDVLPFTPSQSATSSSMSTPTSTSIITPVVDASVNVTVLNGTKESGWAASAADTLKADGWKNIATANASETDIKKTVVYYVDEAHHAAALGLARSFPGASIVQTDSYADTGSELTVVLGSDYVQAAS